jgi:hypothetical protein
MVELTGKSNVFSHDLEQVLRIPLGAASPLWFVIGGAASAGMAYWWATQWMRPLNLEAAVPPEADALLSAPVGGEAGPLAGAAGLVAAEIVETAAMAEHPSFAPVQDIERSPANEGEGAAAEPARKRRTDAPSPPPA